MKDLTETQKLALRQRLFKTIEPFNHVIVERIILDHLLETQLPEHPAITGALTHWAHGFKSVDQMRASIIEGRDLDAFIEESVEMLKAYYDEQTEETKASLRRLDGIVKEVFGD